MQCGPEQAVKGPAGPRTPEDTPVIQFPLRRFRRDPTIEALYGTIVAQARSPGFYRDFGVPDTVSARIDMIMLHLVLVLRRLRANAADSDRMSREKPAPDLIRGVDRFPDKDMRNVKEQAQLLFDRFCQDMDDNFREMGVGDLKVPKEMRRIGAAFYGRARVYDAALDAGDSAALAAAVSRNVFGTEAAAGASALAAYMQEAARTLAGQPITGLAFSTPESRRP